MKIGILTFHFAFNCGAALQCFALQKTLKELGNDVHVINYCPWYHQNRYVYPKFDKELCIGCGRCEVSCNDGGHQAIVFETEVSLPSSGEVRRGLRRPRLIGTECVGCHLCRLVCPAGAIGVTKRIEKKNK